MIFVSFAHVTGPSISVGKHGNAIFIPTTGGTGNMVINLGTHEHDCFGNIGLCPNGATFSLWFKPLELSTEFGTLFRSSSLVAYMHQTSAGAVVHFNLNNGSHIFNFFNMQRVAWDQWYHVGITYSRTSGFAVYFDRCAPHLPDKIKEYNKTIKNFELGCSTGMTCGRVHLDDLRFWTVKKSTQFIWNLFNM